MEIEIGLLADSLIQHLKDVLPKETVQKFDNITEFLILAHLDGKLTDRQKSKLFDYLLSLIQKEVDKTKENK